MRVFGIALMVLGIGVVLATVTNSKIVPRDRRHEAAYVRWRGDPTPKTEAAWRRERRRVERVRWIVDLGLTFAGAVTLLGGMALVARGSRALPGGGGETERVAAQKGAPDEARKEDGH